MPHDFTTKSIEITTVALQKSLIESGTPDEEMEKRLRFNLNLYSKLVNIQLTNKSNRA